MRQVTAIIVDDEEQLRDFLKRRLAVLWPDLHICGEAANGDDALKLGKTMQPDVAFLDISMPGLSGIEVARILAKKSLPVLITAYDKFAVEAFEAGAIDYLLKPVSDSRLENTVKRLKTRLASPSPVRHEMDGIFERLASAVKSSRNYLQWIKVKHRESIRLISVHEILYFKATDKYTVVRTKNEEFLIRKTIRELLDELSPDQFWQIHRATLVNVDKIQMAARSLTGSYHIHLTDLQEILPVSRSFSYLFKQM